jgi:GT2 family glycosyltransferase
MKRVVIIPVHNQLHFLKKCVGTVMKKTKEIELVVIDDGSTDVETTKWINNFLCCHKIKHENSRGFSASCNDGIDYAIRTFDFNCLCLLNSDTEVITDNWFERVENEVVLRPNIGVVGVVSNNAVHQTIFDIPKYLEKIDEKPTLYTNLIHGFCYFISKKLILSIGRFDDDMFPHYGSEDDYALKSIKAGFNNIIVGSVLVNHNGATSYTESMRNELVKMSMPNLCGRWGKKYIDGCVKESEKILKLLNND